RQAGSSDPFPDTVEGFGRNVEHAERVLAVAVIAERHDEGLGAEGAGFRQRLVDSRMERSVVCLGRKRDIDVAALAIAMAALVGISDVKGIIEVGVNVDGSR